MSNLTDRIAARGPKKLLALDGGGIPEMITVEILAKIGPPRGPAAPSPISPPAP